MAIVSSEITRRLSGGASNTSAAASLGGIKSSALIDPAALFDEVSASESAAGRIEYRCIYMHNASGTDTLQAAVAWLNANTASTSTTLDIGLGSSAINGIEPVVANETTAPSGVTFSAAASKAAGITLGNIPPGQHRAIWLRRTVTAGAAASSDTATLAIEGSA